MSDFHYGDDRVWTPEELAELDRNREELYRKYPDDPATIKGLAFQLGTRKEEELSQFAQEWLDLARKEPNHPRVIAVRKEMAEQAVQLKKWREYYAQLPFERKQEKAGSDSQQQIHPLLLADCA